MPIKTPNEVKSQIESAFLDVPIPSIQHILACTDDWEQLTINDILQGFGGKHWTTVDPFFIEFHWTCFYNLTAEAYQQYLPSLLTVALDNFSERPCIVDTLLYCVRPSDNEVYYKGRDEYFEEQTSLFTPQQFEAVAAFFGLFLEDSSPYMSFFAARALRFGWDRVETPERRAFHSFCEKMHNWRYEAQAPDNVASLVREIESAFETTPYPGDQNLSGSEQGDESAANALNFMGVNWRKAHPKLLLANYTSLSFLTAEGFRYFLPAYILAELYGADKESNANSLFALIHGFRNEEVTVHKKGTKLYESVQQSLTNGMSADGWSDMVAQNDPADREFDWFELGREKMSHFSKPEREAIIHYLQYRALNSEFQRDEITQALENYWIPSLVD